MVRIEVSTGKFTEISEFCSRMIIERLIKHARDLPYMSDAEAFQALQDLHDVLEVKGLA